MGLIPGLRRSPGIGHGNPFRYSCLENPMNRGAWWTIVHGVTKSQTLLKDSTHIPTNRLLQPIGRFHNQELTLCVWPVTATVVLRQTTEETVMSHLTIFAPHSVQALLNSHHTQHYSTSRLTSHEIILLSPNITIHRSLTQLPCCWRNQVSKMKNMIVLFLTKSFIPQD